MLIRRLFKPDFWSRAQAGQEWARRLEAKELARIAAEEAKEKKDL